LPHDAALEDVLNTIGGDVLEPLVLENQQWRRITVTFYFHLSWK
jgi:hypothetical protein